MTESTETPSADSLANNATAPRTEGALISPAFQRLIWWGLGALGLLALVLYGPASWTAYQDRKLRTLDLPHLESYVKSHPANINARYYLGLAYARMDRDRDASREFLAVLDRAPDRADVLNDLGVSYLPQQRYYEALVALRAAILSKPNFAAAYANLGRLHLTTKMPFTAARELRKAVQLDPDNVDSLCDLGLADQSTLNYKGGEDAFRRAIRLSPRNARAHLGLGKILYSMGQYDNAANEINTAMALDPTDPTALLALARIKRDAAVSPDDLGAARQLLVRATQENPQDTEAWYELGRIAMRLNQPADAVKSLERALQLAPGYSAALNQLDRAYRALGRTADADRVARLFREQSLREREETRLEERTTREPNDWNARIRLAELYILSGQRGLAMLICRQLKESRPDDPRLPALLSKLNASTPSGDEPSFPQAER